MSSGCSIGDADADSAGEGSGENEGGAPMTLEGDLPS